LPVLNEEASETGDGHEQESAKNRGAPERAKNSAHDFPLKLIRIHTVEQRVMIILGPGLNASKKHYCPARRPNVFRRVRLVPLTSGR
jgi:hypothetical protein